jgi:hypothetical protein
MNRHHRAIGQATDLERRGFQGKRGRPLLHNGQIVDRNFAVRHIAFHHFFPFARFGSLPGLSALANSGKIARHRHGDAA